MPSPALPSPEHRPRRPLPPPIDLSVSPIPLPAALTARGGPQAAPPRPALPCPASGTRRAPPARRPPGAVPSLRHSTPHASPEPPTCVRRRPPPAGGDSRPRMRSPSPASLSPGIRRIQAPPGKRGAPALRLLSGSSPPGAGSQLHRRVKNLLFIFFFPREIPRNLWEKSGTSHLTSSQNRFKLCSLQRRLVEAGSIPLEIQFNSLNAFTA